MKSVWLTLLAVVCVATVARAQTTPEVSVAPIECWWKTDRSAVRVAEPFNLTLTCAVLDTEKVKVVADESSLAPGALHLVPFEIVDGHRYGPVRNSPRSFFQYQYVVRILGEDFFGKEVALPKLQITYRVQNSLTGGNALAGREAQYTLNPIQMRVLSLVPATAADIRDTPAETFADVDRRMFESNVMLITGGVALALAALIAVVIVTRAALRRRADAAAEVKDLSPVTILGAALRELSAVDAARSGGWTPELAGRAAAAIRLAGAVSLGRPVGRKDARAGAEPSEGQIAARLGVRRKIVLLSAATTSTALAGPLAEALALFTSVRYSRETAKLDSVALDSALAEAQDQIKKLRVSRLFRLGRTRRTSAAAARQSWAR